RRPSSRPQRANRGGLRRRWRATGVPTAPRTSSSRARSSPRTRKPPSRSISDSENFRTMKRRLPNEFLYQVFALIIITIVVHSFYVTVVRPRAFAVLAEQALRMQQDVNYTADSSFWVVIKDYEQ